jgi:hypothetical protein
MRGIYLRGNIYWLARQVDKKRHFVSLETSEPVQALSRAQEIRSEGVLESGTILCIAGNVENGRSPLNAAKDTY